MNFIINLYIYSGICNHSTGRCTCFTGMISSGTRNDCGSVMEIQIADE